MPAIPSPAFTLNFLVILNYKIYKDLGADRNKKKEKEGNWLWVSSMLIETRFFANRKGKRTKLSVLEHSAYGKDQSLIPGLRAFLVLLPSFYPDTRVAAATMWWVLRQGLTCSGCWVVTKGITWTSGWKSTPRCWQSEVSCGRIQQMHSPRW